MIKTSDAIDALADALAKAQGEIENAVADSKNPHFNSTYADLASVREATVRPLSKYELSVVQLPTVVDGKLALSTRLLHKSGQWIEATCPLLIDARQNMQALGSAITYMRRYAMAALLFVAQADDDGNAESVPQAKAHDKPKAKVQPAAASPVDIKALADARLQYGWSPEGLRRIAHQFYGASSPSQLNATQCEALIKYMTDNPLESDK